MLLISIFLCAVSSSVLLIPALLAMNRVRFHSWKRALLYYLFAVYLCIVYHLVGPPDITYFRWDPGINWIPVIGIAEDFRSSSLNVLLFMPLGAALPLLWKKYRSFGKSVLFGFCMSFAIEVSQMFTFRATDINDLITNTLGTALGYAVMCPFLGRLTAEERDDALLVAGLCTAVMFFAEPFIFNILYDLI